ncbi:hypothetical protein AAMO2058_001093800 [Amorphochlora amoebiformis]
MISEGLYRCMRECENLHWGKASFWRSLTTWPPLLKVETDTRKIKTIQKKVGYPSMRFHAGMSYGYRRKRPVEDSDEDSEIDKEADIEYTQRQNQLNGRSRRASRGSTQSSSQGSRAPRSGITPEEDMSADEEDFEEKLSQERGYNEEEMNAVVGDVMNYILLQHSTKTPVKMADVSKNIINQKSRHSRLSNETVMNIVKKRFKHTFGFKLVELRKDVYNEEKKKPTKTSKRKQRFKGIGTNTYILMNGLKGEQGIEALNLLNEKEHEIQGLLMTIFGLILLDKGQVYEAELWQYLQKLGIHRSSDIVFGNAENLIRNVFVKQMYLSRTKKKSTEAMGSNSMADVYIYTLGKRALQETKNSKIYLFIHKVLKKAVNQARYDLYVQEEQQVSKDEAAVEATQR